MKRKFGQPLKVLAVAGLFSVFTAFPAMAAIQGDITSVTSDEITGWAWETGSYDTTIPVEIQIFPEGETEPVEVITAQAEEFSQDLSDSIGDGWHAFCVPVDWNELGDGTFEIQVYSVMGETRTQLGSSFTYSDGSGSRIIEGPGDAINVSDEEIAEEPAVADAEEETVSVGEYLGTFAVTGYCNCEKCSGGHGYTYSGTVPQANHTLSADLTLLPLGTKVMIDDIVYTVEDKGGGVDGKKVDIYFATHEEALAFGTQQADVYLAS